MSCSIKQTTSSFCAKLRSVSRRTNKQTTSLMQRRFLILTKILRNNTSVSLGIFNIPKLSFQRSIGSPELDTCITHHPTNESESIFRVLDLMDPALLPSLQYICQPPDHCGVGKMPAGSNKLTKSGCEGTASMICATSARRPACPSISRKHV